MNDMRKEKDDFQQKLEKTVTYFINAGKSLNDAYSMLWPTERAMAMYSLLLAGRRLSAMMAQAVRKQECSTVDVTRLDLVEVRGQMMNLMTYLEHGDCDLQISYSYSEGSMPIYVPSEIVDEENLDFKFPDTERTQAYVNARTLLITKANNHYQEVLTCIKGIIAQLERLIDDAKRLRRDPELMAERTAAMEAYYTKRLWPKHKEQLEARVDAELKDDENSGLTPTKIIKAMIKDMEADYERNHDEQTFDDMMRMMQHKQSVKYLETRIVAIAMKAPCDAYEGKLFTNKAAYEVAKLMGKAFYNYVGFDKKIKSSFICAALMDFKLMQKDCNNTRLVVEFINNELLGDKDDKVNKDAIIKPLRKCSGKPFCTIDEDNLRDFTKEEFAKYKDLYWRSFSIINKVIGVGDKMAKAAYLDEIHEVIEEKDVFDYLGDDEMTRLKLLSSVIKQRWV
jgi:hypothetical protein